MLSHALAQYHHTRRNACKQVRAGAAYTYRHDLVGLNSANPEWRSDAFYSAVEVLVARKNAHKHSLSENRHAKLLGALDSQALFLHGISTDR
eukprot:2915336-Pleurochrysis_carterae.AAC.1